jgi:hypothetical protein
MTESKKLRWLVDPDNRDHRYGIIHWCPGCEMRHLVYIAQQRNAPPHPVWAWNGEFNNRITTTPSVQLHLGMRYNEGLHPLNIKRDEYDVVQINCHYFITGGNLVFCGDSSHNLAGLTVELPNFPADEED